MIGYFAGFERPVYARESDGTCSKADSVARLHYIYIYIYIYIYMQIIVYLKVFIVYTKISIVYLTPCSGLVPLIKKNSLRN